MINLPCIPKINSTWLWSIILSNVLKVKVTPSCPTLWPHGWYSPWNSPGQNTGAFPFSRGSSQPRDWTRVSCIADGFFYQLSYWGSPLMYYCIILSISSIALFNFLNIWNTVIVSLLVFLSTNYHICVSRYSWPLFRDAVKLLRNSLILLDFVLKMC